MRYLKLLLCLPALLLAAGCGGDDDTLVRDAAIESPDDGALQEAALGVLEAARDRGDIDGYALEVGTETQIFARIVAGDVDALDAPVLIASAGKPVSAAVVLSLVNDGRLLNLESPLSVLDPGRLQLDVPIARWLGDTPAGNTAAAQEVTLRQLLNHTSGLETRPDCVSTFGDGGETTLQDCATEILQAGTAFEPGSRFAYGAGGYHVAGAVAEAFSEQPWQTLVDERIADPLGIALPYFPLTNPRIGGGILTSVADLGTVMRALLAGDDRILRAADYRMMRSSQVDDTGDGIPGVTATGYSFGLWIEDPAVLAEAGSAGPELSAPGLVGTTPWLDDDRGYYAVLLLRQSDYLTSLALMRELRAQVLAHLP